MYEKIYSAEREGFEPSVPRWGHTRFPGEPVQPLRHLSKKKIYTYCNGLTIYTTKIKKFGSLGFYSFSFFHSWDKFPHKCCFDYCL